MFLFVFRNRANTRTIAVIGLEPEHVGPVFYEDRVATLDMNFGGREAFHRCDTIGVTGVPSLGALKARLGDAVGRILFEADLATPNIAMDRPELSDPAEMVAMIQRTETEAQACEHSPATVALRISLTRADVDCLAESTARGEMTAVTELENSDGRLMVLLNVFEDAAARDAENVGLRERANLHAERAGDGKWKATGQA